MPLLEEFASDFDRQVQARGREYFRRGAAAVTGSAPGHFEATVQGGEPYRVRVDWDEDGGQPDYRCTCPFFQDRGGQPCKHLWAALLKANREGLLVEDDQAHADDEQPDAGLSDDEGLEDGDGADDDDMVVMDRGPDAEVDPDPDAEPDPTVAGNDDTETGANRGAAKAGDAQWKRQLAKLREDMRAAAVAHEQPASAWPDNKRLVYVVDLPGTVEGTGLTIELAQEALKRDGRWDKARVTRVGREQTAGLPEQDRQIVQLLLGARRGDYGAGYYGFYPDGADSPRKFVLPESAYLTTFRQMVQTGRCRLRTAANDDDFEPLEWDDGEPWEFWLEVKSSPGGRYYLLDGSLRRKAPAPQGNEAANRDEARNGDEVNGDDAGIGEDSPKNPGIESASNVTPREIQPRDGEQRMAISEPQMMLRGGLLFADGKVARLNHFEAFPLVLSLRDGLKLSVPLDQHEELMRVLYAMPRLPKLDLPESLRLPEVRPTPRPRLRLRRPSRAGYDDRFFADLSFDYEGLVVKASQEAQALVAPGGGRVVFRDVAAERAFLARLLTVGFRESFDSPYSPAARQLRLPPKNLSRAVADLTAEGWHVEAEGKLYRQPGEFKVSVSSGIDWFELHGYVDFGQQRASLPALLAALRRGEKTITLDDGSIGMLPQEWLKKYAPLAALGDSVEDHLRFTARQVGFLDALLSSMPDSSATFDATFSRAREQLARFGGVEPLDAPTGFTGQLRAYQRDGLGWMQFLRTFGFGGCLADDMGLGKTVQVLALLEHRRQLREAAAASSNGNGAPSHNGNDDARGAIDTPAGPSLVVVPRSLVFNWKAEAARFTPTLKVLDHTSAQREKDSKHFQNYDLILTTYGTLRRDAAYFKDVNFDYAILDEAQAIKNAASESAKASRLLRADHRLALSGTPVQNHLGELWSLFEFLNPGMMGAASAFKEIGVGAVDSDPQARTVLAKALRPFILRRTKEQVAPELPDKTEQTLYCEMEAPQRKLYDELRDHYRTSLLERIAREGINKAKVQILEALLRLRQAACHPGLIDKERLKEGSAKLDTLLEQIDEVVDEGHKVLVFSQFTSFLAIVRDRLDSAGKPYEYLDGKTRDRQEKVERFQNDPTCKLFLISLKAGGLGLNLTAAEYVYLLDPWWNPAVEAQAIDRAHRIGQTRRVFAYRLIAKDTVEEKVLQLQQSKKDLADAIITADNSVIRSLGREDLELLLS